ncbi:hypothetical protein [Novipirellula artificiosorum]|uniref:Uncharacterized protein n=1 Tax=Novipirellula artificiosorum TaxID=2528016 RepID=A0A5C6DUY5_9BACT|nr:hypothetical protein [Novipirellula artificiosorum]TWU38579.1 hypothetical protein Poly41_30560 [Novipirellula artificiosorum]
MKNDHFELARCLVAEIEVFGELATAKFPIRTSWLNGMEHHGIPFEPTYWATRKNSRKRMRLGRTTKKLVELRHLQRLTLHRKGRTSHVVPTADFLAETITQLDVEASRNDFFAGLFKTRWGRDMIEPIREQLKPNSHGQV